MIFECSGSEKIKHPLPENVKCPFCSQEVEIWTDEVEVVCPNCKKKVSRQQGQTCLDWCSFAKECVGEDKYKNYMRNKALTLKDKLINELEVYFGADKKRISHAKKVMDFAEEILKKEKADWHIVIPASILHDVGIKLAEEKYGSNAGHFQEKEGPEIARGILEKLGFKKENIEQICLIIAHHHTPGIVDTLNFRVLYDADQLVNFKEEVPSEGKEKLKAIIEKVFLTSTGQELAREVYLKKSPA